MNRWKCNNNTDCFKVFYYSTFTISYTLQLLCHAAAEMFISLQNVFETVVCIHLQHVCLPDAMLWNQWKAVCEISRNILLCGSFTCDHTNHIPLLS